MQEQDKSRQTQSSTNVGFLEGHMVGSFLRGGGFGGNILPSGRRLDSFLVCDTTALAVLLVLR